MITLKVWPIKATYNTKINVKEEKKRLKYRKAQLEGGEKWLIEIKRSFPGTKHRV